MRAVLLAPHHDDETLFAAFSIIKHRPKVIVVLESHLQEQRALGHGRQESRAVVDVSNEKRKAETFAALCELEGPGHHDPGDPDELASKVEFWPYRDDRPDWEAISDQIEELGRSDVRVFAPALHDGGHEQHNAIAALVMLYVPPERRTMYSTYRAVPGNPRVTGYPVEYEPAWIARKLRALACYRSQIELWPHHFLDKQNEYTI